MRVLLDTHALLWGLLDSPRLSPGARQVIASAMVEKLISPVNALELTQKYRVGKLDEAAPFLHNGRLVLDDYAVASLPITLEHASLAGSMDIAHKDPFDRLLIAQSIIERVPLVSNEALFDHFGVERIW